MTALIVKALGLQKKNLFFFGTFLGGITINTFSILFSEDKYVENLRRRVHLLAGMWRHNKLISIILTLMCSIMISNMMQYHILLIVYALIVSINVIGRIYEKAIALIISAILVTRC